MLDEFYLLTKPMEWATVPAVFSYSLLQRIEKCPHQWQLLHSKFGTELNRFPARPSAAAVEGNIIHSVLEKLLKSLFAAGLPALGSSEFRDCISKIEIKKEVNEQVLRHGETIAIHPRGNGFRLHSTIQQLTNKITRLFRQQYADLLISTPRRKYIAIDTDNDPTIVESSIDSQGLLAQFGGLSEHHIKHPIIPLQGIIDFVFIEDGSPVIVDFKTGAVSKDHMDQVLVYAVLWWRQTDKLPKRVEVQYPDSKQLLSIDEQELVKAEKNLEYKITKAKTELSNPPAFSRHGDHCVYCDVRQFCESYWHGLSEKQPAFENKNNYIDVEMKVTGKVSNYGFIGMLPGDIEVPTVYSEKTVKCRKFKDGQWLRVLSALPRENELVITPRTEIYYF